MIRFGEFFSVSLFWVLHGKEKAVVIDDIGSVLVPQIMGGVPTFDEASNFLFGAQAMLRLRGEEI